MVSRGEVWLTEFTPPGEADGGSHPCVIVSPPEIHDFLRVVMVAPLTAAGKPAAYRVPVKLAGVEGVIRLEQLRTVDRRQLIRQVGEVERQTLDATLATLREMFAE
jgi:mRNA interferase MazF